MKNTIALAILAIVLAGCGEEDESAYQLRSLEQMLELGANQYLIDKYETNGNDTDAVLDMLESVGREGADNQPEQVKELMARGFVVDKDTPTSMSRWIVERQSM